MKIVKLLAVLLIITLLGAGVAVLAKNILIPKDREVSEEASVDIAGEIEDTEHQEGEIRDDENDKNDSGMAEHTDSSSSGGTKKIVCVGDSLTRGDGVEDKKRDSYPAQLEAMLGDGYEVYNYGVDGRCLLKNSEMPYTDTGSFDDSIEENGDIYIIMLGSNDSISKAWNPDRFKSELYEFVQMYLDLPSRPRVILGIPPRGRNLPEDNEPPLDVNDRILEEYIRPVIMQCAADKGLTAVDLYKLTDSKREWYSDSTHMNPEGYGHLAESFRDAVEKH